MRGRSPTLQRVALSIVLSLPLALSATSASAADDAFARFDRGVQLYEAENYDGALIEFNAAHKLTNNYKLLYNIAICQAATKDYAAAAATFQRYLTEGGSDIAAARRTDVKERLARLALMITRLRVTTNAPAGATLMVDDQPVASTPLPEAVTVKVGRRQLSIASGGRTVSKVVEVASGDQNPAVNLTFEAAPVATAAPNATPATAHPSGPSFPWVFWGLTAAFGVGAVATGIVAVDARNDLATKQATYGVRQADLDGPQSKAQTFGIITDVLLGATVVSAGLSTYFTIRYFGKKQSRSAVIVQPTGIGYVRSF